MYVTRAVVVKPSWSKLYDYCRNSCEQAKLMKNAVIFRCRQLVSADGKEPGNLRELEKQVLNEFGLMCDKTEGKKIYIPNYFAFERMFRDTKNPDFFNGLPMQSSQNIIKAVLDDFRSFFKAIKAYYKNPGKFPGKPRLPKYVKGTQAAFDITNQDAVIKACPGGHFLKLPKTKAVVPLGNMEVGKLKEITVVPFYDTYKICIVMETDICSVINCNRKRIVGIDLGINNFAAVNNNCGLAPFIIKGKNLKSYNQWYNKELSKLKSYVMKGDTKVYTSNRIRRLNKSHYNKTTDFYNKAASYIVKYCVSNDIGTVVVGKNDGWKQRTSMGSINNQNFCFIAHALFIKKLEFIATRYGIEVLETEESYTSKADLMSLDDMKNGTLFHGERIMRGLYRNGTGNVINADINGAGNIIRKVFTDAFTGVNMDYMTKTTAAVIV